MGEFLMTETTNTQEVGFLEAITNKQNRKGRTLNGARTLKSSGKAVSDLFFALGNVRTSDTKTNMNLFINALIEDAERTLKILFYARDIRGGQGERKFFRDALKEILVGKETKLVFDSTPNSGRTPMDFHNLLVMLCAEYGRFDDYFDVMEEILKEKKYSDSLFLTSVNMFSWIKQYLTVDEEGNLVGGNQLLFKWLPRKGLYTNRLRKFMGMDRKTYRKLLVSSTETVEQKITRKEYDSIEFQKLPSLALKRHTKFFNKNIEARFLKYKESLAKGEVKINASTLYPYDVIDYVKRDEIDLANGAWKALPNFFESNKNILPVIDVSHSMGAMVTPKITAMDVAVGLGIYLSEHIKGYFNNNFITFHTEPELIKMKKNTFTENYRDVLRAPWGGSTNLMKVFELVLKATQNSTNKATVPDAIIIVSDMEFNEATGRNNKTNFEAIEKMYQKAGFKRPNLIFWNVTKKVDKNFPVTADENGTVLLGGFSPAIMGYLIDIIDDKEVNTNRLIDVVTQSERYNAVEDLLPFINNEK